MESKVITEKQNLTYLQWSHVRTSSGTAGTFLKSQAMVAGEKMYYKLSGFDSEKGIVGHECVNELIVDRLLTILGVEHVPYQLIHAQIQIEDKEYDTWLCASRDFKLRGETKTSLDNYYLVNKKDHESRYEFCLAQGWQKYIEQILAVDYLILNRDRHGSNVEVLRNARKRTLRIAPLFDHGLSLLCSCYTEKQVEQFDVKEDKPCNNFIGGRSTLDNLQFIKNKESVFASALKTQHKKILFADLEQVLSAAHLEKIWKMLWTRWKHYENLCNL